MAELEVNAKFDDVNAVRRAVKGAAIAQNFEISVLRSDTKRYTVQCKNHAKGCKWRLHASKIDRKAPIFSIKNFISEHTCQGADRATNKEISSSWLAEKIIDRLRENPDYRPSEIVQDLRTAAGIEVPYKSAWSAKEKARKMILGSSEDDYTLLPLYCESLKQVNKDSAAFVEDVGGHFSRLFLSFGACIEGFAYCRPLIELDCVYLKNRHSGVLLYATGADAEGCLYPIAFAVVNADSDENWLWFLENLKKSCLDSNQTFSFVSDRRPCLLDGVMRLFGDVSHGLSIRHLVDEFAKTFKHPVLVAYVRKAAFTLKTRDFDADMSKIMDISQEAAQWLLDADPKLWANSHYKGPSLGHSFADGANDFNLFISSSSTQSVYKLLECIRRKLMTWFYERRLANEKRLGVLAPTAEALVAIAMEKARYFDVFTVNENEYECVSGQESCVVNLSQRFCSCYAWQNSGVPCPHVASAVLRKGENVAMFADTFVTLESYCKSYMPVIWPVPDSTSWDYGLDVKKVLPPAAMPRPPGRPKKEQTFAEKEKRTFRCSRCGVAGHSRRTCGEAA